MTLLLAGLPNPNNSRTLCLIKWPLNSVTFCTPHILALCLLPQAGMLCNLNELHSLCHTSVITSLDEVTLPGEAFGDGFNSDLPAPLYLHKLDQAYWGPCLPIQNLTLNWITGEKKSTSMPENTVEGTLLLFIACTPTDRSLQLLIHSHQNPSLLQQVMDSTL